MTTDKATPRTFELRFKGLTANPVVVATSDGYLKYPNEVIQVIEHSAYQRVVEALKQWHQFEKEQVLKEGPYVGARINDLISMTHNTLKELGEIV